jgi:hypothetical protein
MFKATTLHFLHDANETQLRAVLYKYVEQHPECLEDFVAELIVPLDDQVRNFPYSGGGCRLTNKQFRSLRSISEGGNKVMAIKEHRGITQFGLKESKDWVEEHFFNNPHIHVNI